MSEIGSSTDSRGEKCEEKEKGAEKAPYLLTYWRRREASRFIPTKFKDVQIAYILIGLYGKNSPIKFFTVL
jgi:hypothetical protein